MFKYTDLSLQTVPPQSILPLNMLSSVLFTTVLAAVLVNADPSPSEPSPGSVFKEGENCRIAWDVDATGTWKTMNIELMSGSNWAMNHITSERN